VSQPWLDAHRPPGELETVRTGLGTGGIVPLDGSHFVRKFYQQTPDRHHIEAPLTRTTCGAKTILFGTLSYQTEVFLQFRRFPQPGPP